MSVSCHFRVFEPPEDDLLLSAQLLPKTTVAHAHITSRKTHTTFAVHACCPCRVPRYGSLVKPREVGSHHTAPALEVVLTNNLARMDILRL